MSICRSKFIDDRLSIHERALISSPDFTTPACSKLSIAVFHAHLTCWLHILHVTNQCTKDRHPLRDSENHPYIAFDSYGPVVNISERKSKHRANINSV